MAASTFTYTIYIRAALESVWRALRAPEFTRQYWCETWQDSAWETGAAWRLIAPDGRVADTGEVVAIDPPRKLVLCWRHQLQPDLRAEGNTLCTYELEQADDAVKLTVRHESEIAGSKLIEDFARGWPPILSSLKSLLETGAPLELTRRWPESV